MDEKLKALGLSPNETKVYKALLELGENTVGPLIKKLKMHRQVVYDALEGLEKKNMVLRLIKGRRNHFKVADPKNILDNVKQQERTARSLITEVSSRLKGQKKGQEIKIYEGPKAVREFLYRRYEDMAAHHQTYVLAGSLKKYQRVASAAGGLRKTNIIRTKKKIKTAIIYSEDQEEKVRDLLKTDRDLRITREYRFAGTGQDSPVSTQIWPDSVTLYSFGDDVFCVDIKNRDFRDSYFNYFLALWQMGKNRITYGYKGERLKKAIIDL